MYTCKYDITYHHDWLEVRTDHAHKQARPRHVHADHLTGVASDLAGPERARDSTGRRPDHHVVQIKSRSIQRPLNALSASDQSGSDLFLSVRKADMALLGLHIAAGTQARSGLGFLTFETPRQLGMT